MGNREFLYFELTDVLHHKQIRPGCYCDNYFRNWEEGRFVMYFPPLIFHIPEHDVDMGDTKTDRLV
jgi:hypothetical protein